MEPMPAVAIGWQSHPSQTGFEAGAGQKETDTMALQDGGCAWG